MSVAPSLFISDLHLTPDQEGVSDCLFDFLTGPARSAKSLFILGDLFEVWLGDDDLAAPFPTDVAKALQALSHTGVAVSIMHGNRDFLLGNDFATASGARLISDPYLIDLHGVPTLLSHGDGLCTDDRAYLRFRNQVRSPAWQAQFLAKPLAERRALAMALRQQSEMAKGDKSEVRMDVNEAAVQGLFRQYACTRLIHGHTHRPQRHLHQVDGQPHERWVLPDWQSNAGYLICEENGCRLQTLHHAAS